MIERLKNEIREKDNMLEEKDEQIKKLQDVLIEYAKSDGDSHIIQALVYLLNLKLRNCFFLNIVGR